MEPVAPAAPAQPAPVVPLSAVQQAVEVDDFSAFESAHIAERIGKPLAPAPAAEPVIAEPPSVAPAQTDEQRAVSKRQQQINDYERRIAEQSAEIARLKTPPPAATAVPPVAPAPRSQAAETDPEPDHNDATKYPEGQFDRAYLRDMSLWGGRKAYREETAEVQARTDAEQRQQAHTEQIATFRGRVDAAVKADPAFLDSLTPEVTNLKPTAYLGPDDTPSAGNVLADHFLASQTGPQLMRHLSQHPEDLTRLTALAPREFFVELGKIEARLESPAPVVAVIPPKTNAPSPPTTLGRRPAAPGDPLAAALEADDFSAFEHATLANARRAGRR